MINITSKEQCCGCGACVQRCVKRCISLTEDAEGFLYPKVDRNACIDCGLCDKVCPILVQSDNREPMRVYAAINNDDAIRMASSSGGIFTLLAESVINRGGVVFGAIFNKSWEVEHTYIESIEDLDPLRRSKYVQSKIGDSYTQAERFLREGREVLFVGSPCQIAGLNRFLRRDYDNLVTVDFICHGVPSPKVWRIYLDEFLRNRSAEEGLTKELSLADISGISFRDKTRGWKNYRFKIDCTPPEQRSISFCEPYRDNIFMRAFLSDIILRPSCHACPAKSGRSGSNLTIADFWGIEIISPEIDDDRGVGLILQNSKSAILDSIFADIQSKEFSYDVVKQYNPSVEKSCRPHPNRTKFFAKLERAKSLSRLVVRSITPPLHRRIKSAAKRRVKKFIQYIQI